VVFKVGGFPTALQAAVYGGYLDIVCLLLERGGKVNAQGNN
jgi:thioredoxin reductase